MSLERRLDTVYLARLLTGRAAPELGEGRAVVRVALQQAHLSAIDDLVVFAARSGELQPSLRLAIAVRRRPQITSADSDTRKLIGDYLRMLSAGEADGREERLGLAVAGWQKHAAQLATLTDHARDQADPDSFFALLDTPAKFDAQLVTRLEHLRELVRLAQTDLAIDQAVAADNERSTWMLLSRLWVLMPRLESPDESDWTDVSNTLVGVAAGGDLAGAAALAERLEVLAAQYAPAAATVDKTMLIRAVAGLLEPGAVRGRSWQVVGRLQTQARAAASGRIGRGERSWRLDRSDDKAAVIAACSDASSVVVHGPSGVGKSTLVLEAAETNCDGVQAESLSLNLRHLPQSPLELESRLGGGVDALLGDLAAGQRLLVIDAADAVQEGRREMFTYLVRSAASADVTVVAVCATDCSEIVRDLLAEHGSGSVAMCPVEGLSDADLDTIGDEFPELESLLNVPRTRELLRRLVVVDLLIRSEAASAPMSDVDALRHVWSGLVRSHERLDGTISPDARERVLLELARASLLSLPAMDVLGRLDTAAIASLRREGILRPATEQMFALLPEFAHDEIRRYAVAMVLAADGDPAGVLARAAAPRWALPAARLACQIILTRPAATQPAAFTAIQDAFTTIAVTGSLRWSDVPAEALLTITAPGPVLSAAWPALRAGEGAGLSRVLRLLLERHRRSDGTIDPVIAEPVMALLLDEPVTWTGGRQQINVLRDWLAGLIADETPAGHLLRIRLRDQMIAAAADAWVRLTATIQGEADAQAARSPEQVAADTEFEARLAEFDASVHGAGGYGPQPELKRVPEEILDPALLELVALLGPDLDRDAEQILHDVARDAPWHLAPAIEERYTGRALASYSTELLSMLAEAYYIDQRGGSGLGDDGVRRHASRSSIVPMAGPHRGPFMALLRNDPLRGIAVVNKILDHAAGIHAQTMTGIASTPGPRLTVVGIAQHHVLSISGLAATYAGDDQVWAWYRGSSIGPYPCTSALLALELVCDLALQDGVTPQRLTRLLLQDCRNLAMPGLLFGVLTRHLDRAGRELDPFLAEPLVWRLEFARAAGEHSGLAADSAGVVEPGRRDWTAGDVAAALVVMADDTRAGELRALGHELVQKAERLDKQVPHRAAEGGDELDEEQYGADVRAWAGMLDREQYKVSTVDREMVVEHIPPPQVKATLDAARAEQERSAQALRLLARYEMPRFGVPGTTEPFTAAELTADLEAAGDLLDNLSGGQIDPHSAVTAVCAAALRGHLVDGLPLPEPAVAFAVQAVLAVAEQYEADGFENAYFDNRMDRAAADAVPLLLLPAAKDLRDECGLPGRAPGPVRIRAAALQLAAAGFSETRVHLTRALDPVWRAPCESAPCHHELALELTIQTLRDCRLGPYDLKARQRTILMLADPIIDSVRQVPDGELYLERLDAPIRSLGVAAVTVTCISIQARALLAEVLGTQTRCLRHLGWRYDQRGSSMLQTARALLRLAGDDDLSALLKVVDAYSGDQELLASLLRALTAAAEETTESAAAGRRVWPRLVDHVLELDLPIPDASFDDSIGRSFLAELIPEPCPTGVGYLYRECAGHPIRWPDLLDWQPQMQAWLTLAVGRPRCVDALVSTLRAMPTIDQISPGLEWLAALVLPRADTVARGSFLLTGWLVDMKHHVANTSAEPVWQEIVDALVVAGNPTLAQHTD
ncbi:hypothetical protein AB0L70_40645 [Kribbella sp. NPDC051952]|uniref:hypothetical protein n=1 Tax=Kribbella sp. NPDC051952 TaxID=3154851 RepID=UPI00343A4D61